MRREELSGFMGTAVQYTYCLAIYSLGMLSVVV